MYVKREGDIGVPVLVHILKTKSLDQIYAVSSYLIEKRLRPLLCQILEIPLDTQRSVDMLNDLIDKNGGQALAN
jgi:hypothetical protein